MHILLFFNTKYFSLIPALVCRLRFGEFEKAVELFFFYSCEQICISVDIINVENNNFTDIIFRMHICGIVWDVHCAICNVKTQALPKHITIRKVINSSVSICENTKADQLEFIEIVSAFDAVTCTLNSTDGTQKMRKRAENYRQKTPHNHVYVMLQNSRFYTKSLKLLLFFQIKWNIFYYNSGRLAVKERKWESKTEVLTHSSSFVKLVRLL